jgi:hypothetical protein
MKAPEARGYAAHIRDRGAHTRLTITGAGSFIEAALLFAERADIEGDYASIEVLDCETGLARCFFIDLGNGDIRSR